MRKFFLYFATFISIFFVSVVVLWISYHPSSSLINPAPEASSNVLGTNTQSNPSLVIAQTKEALRKKNMSFDSVLMLNTDVLVTLSNGVEVIFSPDKDFSDQIDSLQVTMDNLTIEGKRIQRVDMRFDRPVVTLK